MSVLRALCLALTAALVAACAGGSATSVAETAQPSAPAATKATPEATAAEAPAAPMPTAAPAPRWDDLPTAANDAAALARQLAMVEAAIRNPDVSGARLAWMGDLQPLAHGRLPGLPDL